MKLIFESLFILLIIKQIEWKNADDDSYNVGGYQKSADRCIQFFTNYVGMGVGGGLIIIYSVLVPD